MTHKRVNVGCPNQCVNWTCVDLKPMSGNVIQSDAVSYLRTQEGLSDIKAYNLIEHLRDVGEFFFVAHNALESSGLLWIRTDNAEFWPYYLPVIKKLGFAAHAVDDYNPKIMNGSKHYCLFTKMHLYHYAKFYDFDILKISRDRSTLGARLYAVLRKRYS